MIAIDLGSNTLRVIAYDCTTQQVVYRYEKVVKTADGLSTFGFVNSNAVCRVINALHEVQTQLDFEGQTLRAVTTHTLRIASNATAVLAEIKDVTGIDFEIISAQEEARLSLRAVEQRLETLPHTPEAFVLVDVGGGSTEVTFVYPYETLTKSFPIGIVTMTQKYQTSQAMQKARNQEMLAIQMFCANVYSSRGKPDTFVATAGTPTSIAAMKLGFNHKSYDPSQINGTLLEKYELDIYLQKLLDMPHEMREHTVGTGRSDLIATGVLIYTHLYTLLEFDTCMVIDDGLREGVAIEMCFPKTSPKNFTSL